MTKITYLGHEISEKGIGPNENKIKAMRDAPKPTNRKELQSYIGLIEWYSRYLPRLHEVMAPLHALSKQDIKFEWTMKQDEAIKETKSLIENYQMKCHFDSMANITLLVDAGDAGICGVLYHPGEKDEKPSFTQEYLPQRRRNIQLYTGRHWLSSMVWRGVLTM